MTKIKKYKNKKNEDRYEFQIYGGISPLTGKKITTRRRGFKSAKAAEVALSRLELEVEENSGLLSAKPQSQKMTFKDVYDLWFTQYQQTVKESTWATTERIFKNHISDVFDDYLITSITVVECQMAINNWFKAGLKKYHTYLNYAGKVFDFAVAMQLIDTNPATLVIVPRNRQSSARKNLENYYNVDELKHFLACLKDDDQNAQAYVFFRLAAFSGMRKSEMLALHWGDVNFEQNIISVNKTQSRGENNRLVIQTPKTHRSERLVYLDQLTMNVLKHWHSEQKRFLLGLGYNALGDNLIFSNSQNEMFQPVKPQLWLKHTIERYDLKPVTVHAFRHTYATLAIESGVEPKALQEQLGHSSIKTTLDIYTATTAKERNRATDQLAEYLGF